VDRRDFLRRTGTVSGAVGAAALLGAAAGCAKSPGRASSGSSTTSSHGAGSPTTDTSPPNWAALGAMLNGTLVVPGNASYRVDAELYNELFAPAPAAIAYCQSTSDVQRCVTYAREHGAALTARSGGHSYGGYSSCPGLVIDVSRFDQVEAATGGATAVVGAGTQLLPLYSQLGAAGVMVPGGSCPTVGIAGLALGGGIGVFGRAYGMTCDNTQAVTVVTADGVSRLCTPTQHADLYWACRGGGGGNFGVVTSFVFDVHPIPPVNLFTLEWPWAEGSTVLDAWLRWIPTTPDELWSNCQLFSNGRAGGGSLRVAGVFAGQTDACTGALAPLLSAVGAAPTYRFVGPEDYLRAMMIEAGCEGDTVAQCDLPSRSPTGVLSRSAFVAKSTFIDAPLSSSGVTAMINAVETLGADVPQVGGGIVFDGYGGAINRVAPGETAFVHRSAIACAQYSVSFGGPSPAPSLTAAAHTWLENTQNDFAPFARGSYQNYIDPSLPDWAEAYYGTNLPRLRTVKRRYDPDDVFHFAQSIPL
jgi:hypothetical protein